VYIDIAGSFEQGNISYSVLAQGNFFFAFADGGNYLSHHLVATSFIIRGLLLTAPTLEIELFHEYL